MPEAPERCAASLASDKNASVSIRSPPRGRVIESLRFTTPGRSRPRGRETHRTGGSGGGVTYFLVSAAFLVSSFFSAGLAAAGAGWPLALRTSAIAFLRMAARWSKYAFSPALGCTIRTSFA